MKNNMYIAEHITLKKTQPGNSIMITKGIKETKFDYIDSLRGVAILMVILVHTALAVESPVKIIQVIRQFGQMGVVLFFCLSSITQCMSLNRTGVDKRGVQNFYIKRYFRIAPLYYFGIIFYFLMTWLLSNYFPDQVVAHQGYTIKNILANIFFLNGLYPPGNNNIVPGGWSIGTEMLFYLLAPAIFLLFTKIPQKAYVLPPIIMLIISCSFFFIGHRYFNFDIANNTFWYYNIINHLPVFILCFSFYFLADDKKKFTGKSKYFLLLLLPILFACVLFVFIKHFSITITPFLCAFLFIYLILIFKSFDSLNSKLLIKIGQLSYSMYIFHFVFAFQLSYVLLDKLKGRCNINLSILLCYCVTTICAFYLALLSQKVIENKGIALGKKLLKQ